MSVICFYCICKLNIQFRKKKLELASLDEYEPFQIVQLTKQKLLK